MPVISSLKSAAKAAARRTGYEIHRVDAGSTMRSAIERLGRSHPEIATVVDIGASDGRWSAMARQYLPDAQYLLFEALEAVHGANLRKFAADAMVHIVLAAAGDRSGETHFDASDAFGGSASRASTGSSDIVVPMTTVDLEMERLALPAPVMMKLDTHGFEVPILTGASATLRQTEVLIVEAYNFKLGPEALAFPDICDLLGQHGFRPWDLVDVMRRPRDLALWQFDLVFVRTDRPEFRSTSYA